uniref:Uncharacterized protein n=1 Tax=Anguilla anguilla TaxID=7936 RepID=A0A0E9XQK2_ANGAN
MMSHGNGQKKEKKKNFSWSWSKYSDPFWTNTGTARHSQGGRLPKLVKCAPQCPYSMLVL